MSIAKLKGIYQIVGSKHKYCMFYWAEIGLINRILSHIRFKNKIKAKKFIRELDIIPVDSFLFKD